MIVAAELVDPADQRGELSGLQGRAGGDVVLMQIEAADVEVRGH